MADRDEYEVTCTLVDNGGDERLRAVIMRDDDGAYMFSLIEGQHAMRHQGPFKEERIALSFARLMLEPRDVRVSRTDNPVVGFLGNMQAITHEVRMRNDYLKMFDSRPAIL